MPEEKFTLTEMQEILNKQADKTPLDEEETEIPELDVPSIVSLSPENTLKDITTIMGSVRGKLQKNPNSTIHLNMFMRLLDLQCKIQGMFNIKTNVQDMIDSEVNNYKEKVITIAADIIDQEKLETIVNRLTKEGL